MSAHIQIEGRGASYDHRRPYETAETPDMTAARSFGGLILALTAYVMSVAQGKAVEDPAATRPEPDAAHPLHGDGHGLSVADITSPEIGDVVNALASPARVYDGEAVDSRPLIAAQGLAIPPLSEAMTQTVYADADLAPDVDFL